MKERDRETERERIEMKREPPNDCQTERERERERERDRMMVETVTATHNAKLSITADDKIPLCVSLLHLIALSLLHSIRDTEKNTLMITPGTSGPLIEAALVCVRVCVRACVIHC